MEYDVEKETKQAELTVQVGGERRNRALEWKTETSSSDGAKVGDKFSVR